MIVRFLHPHPQVSCALLMLPENLPNLLFHSQLFATDFVEGKDTIDGKVLAKSTKQRSQETYGCFLKWWYPTTRGFPTKNDHFGVFGVPPFLETSIFFQRTMANIKTKTKTWSSKKSPQNDLARNFLGCHQKMYTPTYTNSSPLKKMVGRLSFPFEMVSFQAKCAPTIVITGVIIPISRIITPVTHLFIRPFIRAPCPSIYKGLVGAHLWGTHVCSKKAPGKALRSKSWCWFASGYWAPALGMPAFDQRMLTKKWWKPLVEKPEKNRDII